MFFFFKVLVFVEMLCEMMLWFTEGWPIEISLSAIFLGMVVIGILLPGRVFHMPPKLLIVVSILIAINFVIVDSLQAGVRPIINLSIGVGLYCLTAEYKQSLLQSITKWFAVLIGISLTAFLIGTIFQIPRIGVIRYPFGYEWSYSNYGLYVTHMDLASSILPRFSGPFMEPGHTAIAAVFLLYANKYRIRRNPYMIILTLAVFFTFSLAGYVLGVLGYFLQKISSIKRIIWTIALTAIPYVFVTDVWGGGDNMVNNLIFARLKLDKDKGIEGNNRFSEQTDNYFDDHIKNDLFIGKGVIFYSDMKRKGHLSGAGYKIYIIQYGILGLCLILAFYYTMAINAVNKRYAVSFFILICFCFLQRTYPLWMSWLVPYTCSMFDQAYYRLINADADGA